jgi:hypothetical protein
MTIIDNEMLWRQFGAAIDMLGDALRECPDELWEQPLWEDHEDQWVSAGFSRFWYLAYHTLFWLDLYLSGSEEGFAPPQPFTLTEMEADAPLPPTYSRAQLLDYLAFCRQKCHYTILALSPGEAQRICRFGWGEAPYAELQIYNLRHVQEHGAQLHLFLGQHAGHDARWVGQAE